MAVELAQLIEKVSHMDITLVAGKHGLEHSVSWSHMVETKEATQFLEKGEVAIMTGFGLTQNLTMLELIQIFFEREAAGVIVNIGPFIESIPEDVISFCNDHDFPLFTVPWKIHISEIMRIFANMITKSEQAHLEIASAFKNAIFFPKQEDLYLIPLSQHGFHSMGNYHVCVIKCSPSHRTEKICGSLEIHLSHRHFSNLALFYYEHQIIAVLSGYTSEQVDDFVQCIHTYFTVNLNGKRKFYMGIGTSVHRLRNLSKSYHQAFSIQKLQSQQKISPSLIRYSDLGIYKLLMAIEDQDVLEEYLSSTLAPLLEYDQNNQSDLTYVLKCYLNHNGSIQETANELFVHRNTVNYKLNKASEILKLNLSSLDVRLQLKLSFMLEDLLK